MKIPNLNQIHISFGKNGRRVVKNRELFSPVRDWFILLGIGAVVLLALIGYGLWVYWQVGHAVYGGTQAEAIASNPTYLRHLEDVLTDAQKEREAFEALKANAPFVQDPSL
jgi:hypothetical protein